MSKQLQNLSSYGLDPEELKADKIDKLVADVKQFFSQKDADEKTFEAGASASFLGIGASGSVKTSGKTLKEQMKDNGWKFEVESGFLVPKSFEVHIINRTALQSSGAVSGAIIRQQRGFTGFVHRVSATNLYYPNSEVDSLATLEELRGKVAALEKVKIRRVPEIYIVIHDPKENPKGQVDKTGSIYHYPFFQGGIGTPQNANFNEDNWVTLSVENGKPLEFPGEVTDVVVVPKRRFRELNAFWGIEARVNPEKKSQVQLVALAQPLRKEEIGYQEHPTVHVELIVFYREK